MAAGLEAAAAGGPGVVGTAWNGLTDQAIGCGSSRPCLEPPDPWVAVSATHVVQMVNQSTRITTRTGASPVQLTNRAFFDVAAWSSSAFAADPRVLYDPSRDRWVATLFAGTCSGGALFIAISDTGDPTGTWQRHYLGFPGRWPDFPTLGYSSALVAVGVNEFDIRCGSGGSNIVGTYRGASLHVFDWADLVDGGGSPTASSTAPDPAAFTFVPATGLSAGDAIHAVVALDDGSASRADLAYASISGSVGDDSLVVAAPVSLTTLPLAKLQQPPTPVDAGGLIGVQRNALDLRPTDAVWRNGRLAVADHGILPARHDLPAVRPRRRARHAGRPGHAERCARTCGSRRRRATADTFMPGVGYSDDGTLWTVFSQSSASRYVSSWARRQVAAAAPGAWSAGHGPGRRRARAVRRQGGRRSQPALGRLRGRGPRPGRAGVGLAGEPDGRHRRRLDDQGGPAGRRHDPARTVGAPRPWFVSRTRVAGQAGIPVRLTWSAVGRRQRHRLRAPGAQRERRRLRRR